MEKQFLKFLVLCINFLHETLRSRTAAGTTSYVFGDPKVGKSELVGELTKYFNLFWFSLDGGHSVLYKLPAAQQEKIRLIVLPDTGDYPIAAETCRKVMKPGAYQVCLQHGKVSCFLCLKEKNPIEEINLHALDLDWIIVWDNLSQLGDSIMNHLTKDKEDTFKPGWDEYMPQGQLLTNSLVAFSILLRITSVLHTQ